MSGNFTSHTAIQIHFVNLLHYSTQVITTKGISVRKNSQMRNKLLLKLKNMGKKIWDETNLSQRTQKFGLILCTAGNKILFHINVQRTPSFL